MLSGLAWLSGKMPASAGSDGAGTDGEAELKPPLQIILTVKAPALVALPALSMAVAYQVWAPQVREAEGVTEVVDRLSLFNALSM